MFLECPRIYIWESMQLSPLLIPDTVFTPIILIINPHTVFMGSSELIWYTCLTVHVLMVFGTIMNQNSALVWGWGGRLSNNTLHWM